MKASVINNKQIESFDELKDIKPTLTSLGLDPSSWVEVDTKEIVERVRKKS